MISRTVMSTLMMSPSTNGRSSGIPWHTTLLTEVHTDFGNPQYKRGEGYAFAAMVCSCTNSSICSVVTPGCGIAKVFRNY